MLCATMCRYNIEKGSRKHLSQLNSFMIVVRYIYDSKFFDNHFVTILDVKLNYEDK